MARIPSDIEEQVIQEDEPVSAPPTPSAQEHHDRSARSEGGVVSGRFNGKVTGPRILFALERAGINLYKGNSGLHCCESHIRGAIRHERANLN